jgi:hypothetical protein
MMKDDLAVESDLGLSEAMMIVVVDRLINERRLGVLFGGR